MAETPSSELPKNLERFKTEINRITSRLEQIARDVEALGREPLFNGSTWEQMEGLKDVCFGQEPKPKVLRACPAGIRLNIEQLKQLRDEIAASWSPRSLESSDVLLALWLYLRETTAGRARKIQMFTLIECRRAEPDAAPVPA